MTGDLSDTRTRYIGSRPVKLFRVSMQGGEAVLAMSSRTWISYYYSNRWALGFIISNFDTDGLSCSSLALPCEIAMSYNTSFLTVFNFRFHLTPLSYETLEYAAGFSSEQCPEGIVAISTNTLRILALEKLGAVFNQVTT